MEIRFFPPRDDVSELVERIDVHESQTSEISSQRWLIVPDGDIKVIFPYGRTRSAV